MTVCLLSLGGLPPTAGFIGKWYIFSAAVSAGLLRPRHHRRADQRHLGVLLPARRRDDDMQERGTEAPPIHVTAVSMTALDRLDRRHLLPRESCPRRS